MTLRKLAEKYYHLDYNCAETILLAANEKYQLELAPQDLTVMSGFGGGMCVEGVCGALSGGVAALGKAFVGERAHQSSQIKAIVNHFVTAFNRSLNSTNCAELKTRYKTEAEGCLETVQRAADVLENTFNTFSYSAHTM